MEVSSVAEEPVGIDPVNTALPPNGTSDESTVIVTVPTDARDLDTFSTAPIIMRAVRRETVPASFRYLICFLMYPCFSVICVPGKTLRLSIKLSSIIPHAPARCRHERYYILDCVVVNAFQPKKQSLSVDNVLFI